MPKIIFTSRYIKPTSKTSKSKLKSFVNYVANRDGVEKINVLSKSVSNKQEITIQKALELYPELKNTFEYEDYIKNKTIENGTELLNKFVDDNILSDGDIKNYVSYVGKRPNVQKINTHGLFSNDFYNIDLQKAIKEMSNHKGNIWTHVISLRREDAHRLDYENAEKWHSLIQTQVPDIAKSMNIPTDDLRWYAGFHNESHHPHVHLIVYSKNPQKGFLNNVGIEKIRSSFATEMFKDDRLQIYKNKDLVRKTLNDMAKEKIEKSLEKINASEHENPLISEMLLQLKDELKNLKGRKVYGNLKGVEKQKAKNLVDNIVIEISKNKDIKSIYDEWLEIKKTIEMDYRDSHFTEIDLVNNKEFLTIKNMIIDEALRLENLKFLDLEPITEIQDSDALYDVENIDNEMDLYDTENEETHMKWSSKYKKANEILYDKESTIVELEKAYHLLLKESNEGNVLASFEIAKMYEKGLFLDLDIEKANEFYKLTFDRFNEIYKSDINEKMKNYIEYRIGKMHLQGVGTSVDYDNALLYLTKASDKGNKYAKFSLGGMYFYENGVEENKEKAFELYTESANKNNPFASYQLGKMCKKAIGTETNNDMSFKRYSEAFRGFSVLERETKTESLQYKLGNMNLYGQGVEVNINNAVTHFNNAMELGNKYSVYELCNIYLNGNKENIDIKLVLEKLKTLADEDDDLACYRLGRFYLFDDEYKEEEKALFYFEKSAELKNPYALYELGKMYEKGIGTEINNDLSFERYREAYRIFSALEIETKTEGLQYKLGVMNLYGQGKDIDIKEAVFHFNNSMELGNKYSIFKLFNIYTDGYKNDIDINLILEKLEKLADEDDDLVCYKLGRFYLFDDDYKDKEKGLFYLEKSAENGNEYAEKLLEYLKNNNYSIAPNITKLLYRMGKIISDDSNIKINECNKLVDKKLMKKIAIKKMEQGHKL